MSNIHNPQELKTFIKLFDDISRRHSHYRVFDDFLDLFINSFSFNHKINLENIRKIYSQDERNTFGELIKETLRILDKEVQTDKCFL